MNDHYKQADSWLTVAAAPDLPYEKAVIYASVAQTHAILAQIETARELGEIQLRGLKLMEATTAPTPEGPSSPEVPDVPADAGHDLVHSEAFVDQDSPRYTPANGWWHVTDANPTGHIACCMTTTPATGAGAEADEFGGRPTYHLCRQDAGHLNDHVCCVGDHTWPRPAEVASKPGEDQA